LDGRTAGRRLWSWLVGRLNKKVDSIVGGLKSVFIFVLKEQCFMNVGTPKMSAHVRSVTTTGATAYITEKMTNIYKGFNSIALHSI